MSPQSATPLFIDTGAFYAWFNDRDTHHDRAATLFTGIQDGEFPYRPLYTSTFIIDELTTLTASHYDHDTAVGVLDQIRDSVVRILDPDMEDFDRTCEQFREYDSRELSFTDHMTAVLAARHDIEHVCTFDPDDFRTLGVTVVPGDTGEA